MVAAGSRDPAALATSTSPRTSSPREWGGPVRSRRSAGSGAAPRRWSRRTRAVSPYLLADGFFAGRLRERCSAAYAVADVIGPHPEVVRLVVERAAAQQSVRRSASVS